MISDYPGPEILKNIRQNIDLNQSLLPHPENISIVGHMWGQPSPELTPNSFSIIIAADTLWMDWEHENLVKSMLLYLDHRHSSLVLVVAGLHTGRRKVANFFEVASANGLAINSITEVDVEGNHRKWEEDRGFEDQVERKKWLIVGILKRSSSSTVEVEAIATEAIKA